MRKRSRPGLLFLTIPVAFFGGWLFYGYLNTGSLLAYRAALISYWRPNATAVAIVTTFLRILTGHMDAVNALAGYAGIIAVGSTYLACILLLGYGAYRIEQGLGLYVVISTCAIVAYGFLTSPISLFRYLSFLFPIGLPLFTKRRSIVVLAIVVFIVVDCYTWILFFTDSFA